METRSHTHLTARTWQDQTRFANYCRTGKPQEIAGTDSERMKHYRALVFNQIQNTLTEGFPIASQFLPDNEWQQLVHDFFAHHNSQTYQLFRLPGEFYQWVNQQQPPIVHTYPFLIELLYFEWLEIQLYTMPDMDPGPVQATGDIWQSLLVVNPEHELISLTYPVHYYALQEATQRKGQYFVLLYRMPHSGKVQFMNLSPLLAMVVEQLTQQTIPLAQWLPELERQLAQPFSQAMRGQLSQFIQTLITKQAILGFRNH